MESKKKTLLKLFTTFFKMGLFTFGGGFAMIPLMEKELVENHGWLEKEEFIDTISITQSVPGAVAINLSIFFGYSTAGFIGALVATIGVAIPSFFIILLIALSFNKFKELVFVKNIFKGIRPAVVGLILYAGLNLAKNINWSSGLITIFITVLLAGSLLNLNPIFLIILAIVVATIFYNTRSTKKSFKNEENINKQYSERYAD